MFRWEGLTLGVTAAGVISYYYMAGWAFALVAAGVGALLVNRSRG